MELVVILIIALVVVGPKKLPEVGRSIGKGMREFRTGISGGDSGDGVAPVASESAKT
ncbi:MAG TPA: twin-arginine translocase TatA/TatE family subunit [Solirubrobacteraceae bacterium]|nr:twin-arginine translocase TatA/TatE family subunit [Solirubrobacteraceae bacterium]